MDRDDFRRRLREEVERYIYEEEGYDDNAQLTIDPISFDIGLADGDEEIPENIDHYDIMDLLAMGTEGHWHPDDEALKAMEEDYFG